MVLMMSVMEPQRLWLLVIPAVIGLGYCVLSLRFIGAKTPRSRLNRVIPKDSAIKRHVSVAVAVMAVVSLVLAYAKPTMILPQPRERATIVVAIDISRSMLAEDIQPNRLDAAKEAAQDFVNSLPSGFNVALVSFAGSASIVSPPTLDRSAVNRAIDSLEVTVSTAIGEGIYTSLDALTLASEDPDNPDEPAPGAIVLLSDGSTNIGRDSSEAAQAAADQGVPVYTIAYGTAEGYLIEDGQRVNVPVDHAELSRVARISGGKKYAAESLSDLTDVYQTLARSLGYEDVETEVTDRFALGGLVCALLASMGVISLAARWP